MQTYVDYTAFFDAEGQPAHHSDPGSTPHTRHMTTNLMIDVADDGRAGAVALAHIAPGSEEDPWQKVSARSVHDLDFAFDETMRALEDELQRKLAGLGVEDDREAAIGALAATGASETAASVLDALGDATPPSEDVSRALLERIAKLHEKVGFTDYASWKQKVGEPC